VTAESRWLVDQDTHNRQIKEATGATLFGLDSSAWPCAWADAVVVIEVERVAEHNARFKADNP